ncbi:hypothetical protein CICLE_v10006934mg [Citrus x clementina]|uniref:Uncharacterized protein n=2 Tax=Citrus TaxID=2706 RepID=V4S6L5_CITCL|nr:hypothetical protein CICLE_v10006934mg [Citrus x clementina]GAY54739.1 hypothetical protein CUMW_159050 [Citrus unshiu]
MQPPHWRNILLLADLTLLQPLADRVTLTSSLLNPLHVPVRLHRGEPAVLFSAEEVRDIAKLLNWLLLASFHLAALLWMPWAMKDSIDQKVDLLSC